MSANFDNTISINILLDSAPVTTAGFGTVLVAGAATFAERIKYYESSAAAQSDADLSSFQKLAIQAMFSQAIKPSRVAAGRVEADVAQVVTFTILNDVSQNYTITINGNNYVYDASVGFPSGVNTIASGLQSLVDADPDVSATVSTDTVTVTSLTAGTAFTYDIATSVTPDPTTDITAVETVANKDISDDLAAIFSENPDWYGLTLERRDSASILKAAAFAESNFKLFVAQSDDADILTSATTDVASLLKGLSYNSTAIIYYADDAIPCAEAWAARVLSVDPDVKTTVWYDQTLVGIAQSSLTDTQKTNILGKNANAYANVKGIGATGGGLSASGQFTDRIITRDWLMFRTQEAMAQTRLDAVARGSKIPMNNTGFSIIEAVQGGVISTGITAGHFNAGTYVPNFPRLSDVSDADRASRTYTYSFEIQGAGAVYNINATGYVTT